MSSYITGIMSPVVGQDLRSFTSSNTDNHSVRSYLPEGDGKNGVAPGTRVVGIGRRYCPSARSVRKQLGHFLPIRYHYRCQALHVRPGATKSDEQKPMKQALGLSLNLLRARGVCSCSVDGEMATDKTLHGATIPMQVRTGRFPHDFQASFHGLFHHVLYLRTDSLRGKCIEPTYGNAQPMHIKVAPLAVSNFSCRSLTLPLVCQAREAC